MDRIGIEIGGERFSARLRDDVAPRTCARFRALLPWRERIIHVRWSGEACWIPLGRLDLGLGPESASDRPAPGDVLLYPGGASETEILIAYGAVRFASVAGPLAGNPLLRIEDGLDRLAAIGRATLERGATPILFTQATPCA